ncbi:MAG TPA: hypothetical protein VFL51_09680, partial [Pseudolabrys sp.]|nr:hypothetical protein [Pseudolabrys sp.]
MYAAVLCPYSGALPSPYHHLERHALRTPVFASLALCIATAATAGEIEAPHVTISQVDWQAAAATVLPHSSDKAEIVFARLNAQTAMRFTGIAKSTVPVLLPFDIVAFRTDISADRPDAANSDRYFADFVPSRFFLAGPAGYSATFFIDPSELGLNFDYRKRPIEVEITGAAFTYDLDAPDHQEASTPKALDNLFPGIRRILRDAHVRYAFERFGVPYVVSIQCYDRPPSEHYLSCREADPVAERFLRALHTAGGTPAHIREPKVDLTQPAAVSDSFSFYGPGNLIPNTGWRKLPGRVDRHVYARIRFPIAHAPAYVKSQSFMPWGDCYR